MAATTSDRGGVALSVGAENRVQDFDEQAGIQKVVRESPAQGGNRIHRNEHRVLGWVALDRTLDLKVARLGCRQLPAAVPDNSDFLSPRIEQKDVVVRADCVLERLEYFTV